jgi:spermidine synthase
MRRSSAPWPNHVPLFAAILFTAGGVCASTYQVAWHRLLTLSGGGTTAAVAISVAGFIGGLGIGGVVGGKLSTRRSRAAAWSLFTASEALVMVCAWSSPWWFGEALPDICARLDYGWAAHFARFMSIVAPAIPMGATLPLLVQAETTSPLRMERTIGLLYAANTGGAALGAALGVWYLLPEWGVAGSIQLAAGLSSAIVLGGIGRRMSFVATAAVASTDTADATSARERERERVRGGANVRLSLSTWLGLSAFSGFIAVGFEIVWFRVLDTAVKSTSLTYGTLLAVYLAGLAAGVLIASLTRPSQRDPLQIFLRLQAGATLAAATGIVLLARLPLFMPGYSWLVQYWRSYEGLGISSDGGNLELIALYAGLALLLVGVPTVLFGASFVYLQRAVQRSADTSGRIVGYTQAANVAGNVAGSLFTGFVLFPASGTAGAALALVVLGGGFALAQVRLFGPSRRAMGLVGIIAAAAIALPTNDGLWRRLHGEPKGLWHFEEDADALVAVCEPQPSSWENFDVRLAVNGKGISWFPYGSTHTHLGLLPTLVHPRPRRAAIVGLGSGDTAWGASLTGELTEIDVFEICGAMRRVVEVLARRSGMAEPLQLFAHAGLRMSHDDGRHALLRDKNTYDIIELDALRPQSPGAGNLYSVEFYRLCAERLGEEGLLCQWTPTMRSIRGFCATFPHVLIVTPGPILLGSRSPITVETRQFEERLARTPLSSEKRHEIRQMLAGARFLRMTDLPAGEVNEDLFPRDEFAADEPNRAEAISPADKNAREEGTSTAE